MKTYFPFLKMKQNEIGALFGLEKSLKSSVFPLFDIPRPSILNEAEILHRLSIGLKNAKSYLKDTSFYVDNYDLDDDITLNGKQQYEYILDTFSGFNVTSVAALNREKGHNQAALDFSVKNHKKIAIRLTKQDIDSFKLIFNELDILMKQIFSLNIDPQLIIDLRVLNEDPDTLVNIIELFLSQFTKLYGVSKIVIVGSTIPSSVRDLLKTKTNLKIKRNEWKVWKSVEGKISTENLCNYAFGDYGVVSPDYTDVELNFAILQNVAAPKVFYTLKDEFFIIRGGAFKTHPNGYKQYFTMADYLYSEKILRAISYSMGDKYIHERCSYAPKKLLKGGSPGSWLKATLNSHMTYIIKNL